MMGMIDSVHGKTRRMHSRGLIMSATALLVLATSAITVTAQESENAPGSPIRNRALG